jgi:hypothetical protein
VTFVICYFIAINLNFPITSSVPKKDQKQISALLLLAPVLSSHLVGNVVALAVGQIHKKIMIALAIFSKRFSRISIIQSEIETQKLLFQFNIFSKNSLEELVK